MGNTEQRLSFANLESELAEVKRIGIDTHTQAKRTNGRVTILERFMYTGTGVLVILTPIIGWVTVDYMKHRDQVPKEAIQAAVNQAFKDNFKE